jgi:hypothetical protein
MGKSFPDASGSFLLTNVDLLWANFFYFISFHYTGMESFLFTTNLSRFAFTIFKKLHRSIRLAKVRWNFALLL